jgi:hypothetical protein
MENGQYLSREDKAKLENLLKEVAALKKEHKAFAAKKGGLTPEERNNWRLNSVRTNEVHIEIKELRLKNILEAGR